MAGSGRIDNAGLACASVLHPSNATVCAQMRRVAGWGLFDYLPSLGPEGKRAFLQEVWEHFLDGTFKSYVGQPPLMGWPERPLKLTHSSWRCPAACLYDLLM